MDNKFKTKTGFCYVLPDRIILTRDGVQGGLSKMIVGDDMVKTRIIYVIFLGALCYFALEFYDRNDTGSLVWNAILALVPIYGLISSFRNSAVPIIERKNIKSITFNEGKPGFKRPRFEVMFLNDRGKLIKRLIMLPGSLSDGEVETVGAIKLFKEEGLLE